MKTATRGIWHLRQDNLDFITLHSESGDYIEVTSSPQGLKWFFSGENISDWRDLPVSVLELISLWFTTKKVDVQ